MQGFDPPQVQVRVQEGASPSPKGNGQTDDEWFNSTTER